MRKPRVVIVGAGPAGATCALSLRKRNAAEVVLLDKSTYPRVKVCGSGLSPLALGILESLGMRERFAARHAALAGMRAKGPDGHVVELAAGEGAWVVPRNEFDYALVSEAQKLGATFQQDTKVTGLLRDGRGAIGAVQTNRGDLEADVVVCADGAPSRFSIDEAPKTTIRTLMGWWKGVRLPSNTCVLIWDRRLDGYYAWAFPEPDGITNIGLTIPETAPDASSLKELFDAILAEHFGAELRGAESTRKWMGHPAVITTRLGPIAESRALWIGEAARLVMPGTAEGIGFAMESGVASAEHLVRHFDMAKGFSHAAVEHFRSAAARRVLPKFWAGEGFVRLMRMPRVRAVGARLLSPGVQRTAARAIASLLGDKNAGGMPGPAPSTLGSSRGMRDRVESESAMRGT